VELFHKAPSLLCVLFSPVLKISEMIADLFRACPPCLAQTPSPSHYPVRSTFFKKSAAFGPNFQPLFLPTTSNFVRYPCHHVRPSFFIPPLSTCRIQHRRGPFLLFQDLYFSFSPLQCPRHVFVHSFRKFLTGHHSPPRLRIERLTTFRAPLVRFSSLLLL